jgi:glucan biosynthesis protein C
MSAQQLLPIATSPESAETSPPLVPKNFSMPPQKRMNYFDWLRVWLTVLVIWSHVFSIFFRDFPPGPGNEGVATLKRFYNSFNEPYFMTVFFFLAGYFATPSFNRKGCIEYLKDRFIRLIIPTIVYELVLLPLNRFWRKYYFDPNLSLAAFFRSHFKGYLPVKSHLWFLVLLFIFDVQYAVFRWVPMISKALKNKQTSCRKPWTAKKTIWTIIAITIPLIVVSFFVRVNFSFTARFPIVAQISRLPIYLVAYFLGTPAYLGNSVTRLPKRLSLLLHLPAFGFFAALFACDLNMKMYSKFKSGFNPYQLLSTTLECFFCVLYSIALLVFFREFLNVNPGTWGKRIISSTYTAYIIQYFAIVPCALLLYGTTLPLLVKILFSMILSILLSWILAIIIKLIPGIDRIL